jgi:hypothetical protein
LAKAKTKDVDGRDKRGHDDVDGADEARWYK